MLLPRDRIPVRLLLIVHHVSVCHLMLPRESALQNGIVRHEESNGMDMLRSEEESSCGLFFVLRYRF